MSKKRIIHNPVTRTDYEVKTRVQNTEQPEKFQESGKVRGNQNE